MRVMEPPADRNYLPCAACGVLTHIDDLDGKPEPTRRGWLSKLWARIVVAYRFRIIRKVPSYLLDDPDGAADWTRLECGRCYGPGYAAAPKPPAEAAIEALQAENAAVKEERDEADRWIHEATKTITGLTAGGSEYFAKRVRGICRADLPFCAQRIRERYAAGHSHIVEAGRARKAAESRVAGLQAEVEKLREALKPFAEAHEAVENICAESCQAGLGDDVKLWISTYGSGGSYPLLEFRDLSRARALFMPLPAPPPSPREA
jgi:prefoldin subunit 5